jgi:hypothetical protein
MTHSALASQTRSTTSDTPAFRLDIVPEATGRSLFAGAGGRKEHPCVDRVNAAVKQALKAMYNADQQHSRVIARNREQSQQDHGK